MAKKTNPNGPKGPQVIKDADGKNPRFISSTGAEFYIHPLPTELLDAVEESANAEWREKHGGEPPTPPTYEVELGGETLRYAHDELSILEYPDHKPAWNKWLKNKALYEEIRSRTQARVIFIGSVEIKKEREGWEKDMQSAGLRVAKGGNERKTQYIKTNLPGKESRRLVDEILKLSGVPQEELDKAEAKFRAEVGKPERPDAEGVTSTE